LLLGGFISPTGPILNENSGKIKPLFSFSKIYLNFIPAFQFFHNTYKSFGFGRQKVIKWKFQKLPALTFRKMGAWLAPRPPSPPKTAGKTPSHPLPVWHGSLDISCFFLSSPSKLSGNLRAMFM